MVVSPDTSIFIMTPSLEEFVKQHSTLKIEMRLPCAGHQTSMYILYKKTLQQRKERKVESRFPSLACLILR